MTYSIVGRDRETGELGVAVQSHWFAVGPIVPWADPASARSRRRPTPSLLAALDAVERTGGDLRGRQSAAIFVVPAECEPWDSVVSLHVEDHPEPLDELWRLVQIHDAYGLASRADGLTGEGRHDEAARVYRAASALALDNHELRFWAGLGAAQGGDHQAGVADVRAAIAAHPPWRDLRARLPAEVAPSARTVLRGTRSVSAAITISATVPPAGNEERAECAGGREHRSHPSCYGDARRLNASDRTSASTAARRVTSPMIRVAWPLFRGWKCTV